MACLELSEICIYKGKEWAGAVFDDVEESELDTLHVGGHINESELDADGCFGLIVDTELDTGHSIGEVEEGQLAAIDIAISLVGDNSHLDAVEVFEAVVGDAGHWQGTAG